MKRTGMPFRAALMIAALATTFCVAPASPAPAGRRDRGARSDSPADQAIARGKVRAMLRTALTAHDLPGLDGRTLSFASLDGQVVVLNFWASWCRPCRRELPALDALNARMARSGGRVVAISIDEDAANVRRFVREHGLTLPVYHDGPDGLVRRLDLDRIPYTMVLDRDGSLAFESAGADEAALAELNIVTQRLLAAPGNASTSLQGGNP